MPAWGPHSVEPTAVRQNGGRNNVHELGIVYHIIRDVEDVAQDNGILHVSSVTLSLGEVSGVVPELLSDAWVWAAAKHPVVAGAELVLEPVPAITYCEACGQTYATVEHGKICPHCGSERTYLVQGQEVMIKQIETPDEECQADSDDEYATGGAPVMHGSESPDAVDAAHPMRIDNC